MAWKSATERFTDDGFQVEPVTAAIALRLSGVPAGTTPNDPAAVNLIRDRADSPLGLPEEAVDALIAAGWTDLD